MANSYSRQKTLSRYDSIVEMLKEVMDGTEMVFSLSRALKWFDCSSYEDYLKSCEYAEKLFMSECRLPMAIQDRNQTQGVHGV